MIRSSEWRSLIAAIVRREYVRSLEDTLRNFAGSGLSTGARYELWGAVLSETTERLDKEWRRGIREVLAPAAVERVTEELGRSPLIAPTETNRRSR